jgi:hypothetical protein
MCFTILPNFNWTTWKEYQDIRRRSVPTKTLAQGDYIDFAVSGNRSGKVLQVVPGGTIMAVVFFGPPPPPPPTRVQLFLKIPNISTLFIENLIRCWVVFFTYYLFLKHHLLLDFLVKQNLNPLQMLNFFLQLPCGSIFLILSSLKKT